jgi:hypothetical protein
MWFYLPGTTLGPDSRQPQRTHGAKYHTKVEAGNPQTLRSPRTLVRQTLVRQTLVCQTLVCQTLVRQTLVCQTLVRQTLVR